MSDAVDEDIFNYGSGGSDDENEQDLNYADETQSPWQKSFDELRTKMVKLPNENIYKRIITAGEGEVMGMRKCRIKWEYSKFWEFEKIAFSSSFMNDKKSATVPYYKILTGLWLSLETMKKGEKAEFIIDYRLMYGEFGAPPRIKPKADVLFVVKLLGFEEMGDEDACEGVRQEDRHKFHVMKEKIIDLQNRAIDHFKNNRYRHSIETGNKAVRFLELCHLADDKEQNEQQKMLVQMYTNLCDAYLNTSDWKKVCLMVKEINRLTDRKPNVKLFLNEAIALSHIDDNYDRSISLLRRAQQMEPNNMRVNNTLHDILEAEKKYRTESEGMWKRAFQTKQKVEQGQGQPVDNVFRAKFLETMKVFIDNEEMKSIPLGSTEELKSVEDILAEKFQGKLSISCKNGAYSIKKNE